MMLRGCWREKFACNQSSLSNENSLKMILNRVIFIHRNVAKFSDIKMNCLSHEHKSHHYNSWYTITLL